MNWKQTIGLVVGVGAIVALCFFVIFPALYDKSEPGKKIESAKTETSAVEEDRSVLPKLKGVNWKTAPQAKKPAEKKPAAKDRKKRAPVPTEEVEAAPGVDMAADVAPEPILELQEMAWYEQDGYVVVVGAVKNISNKSLPTVQAYVTFQGDAGLFISEEHSIIELNPIFPGQISPFQVVSRYYVEITNAVVGFRTFSGESIPSSQLEIAEPVTEEGQSDGEGEVEVHSEEAAPRTQ